MSKNSQDLLDTHLNEVVNKYWNIFDKCSTPKDHIMNAVLGLAGEAGEVADLHKKMFFHKSKPEHKEELIQELGDVYFYLLKIMDLHSISLKDVLKANKDKLDGRHSKGGK